MTRWSDLHRQLTPAFGDLRPVAVTYLDSPPDGVEKFEGTVPADHLNCPIGAYTHAIDLPADRAGELERTLSLMTGIAYLRMEEVPAIPRLPRTPAFTYYAPLAATVTDPDVVIFAGRPGPLMRLQEAAVRAGAAYELPLLGRPTCMALPAAMAHGSVLSAGCVGNRVYTDLGDDELYLMLPGSRLQAVAGEAIVIATANETLARYHTERRQALTD